MPAADVVLLPICAILALLGVVLTVFNGVKHRPGRAVQSLGLVFFAAALWLTGLFPVVWAFVVDLVGWATRAGFSAMFWSGLGALVLAVILWVAGGFVAGRAKVRAKAAKSEGKPQAVTADRTGAKAVATAKKQPAGKQQSDPEMDEIEALLKSRGIE